MYEEILIVSIAVICLIIATLTDLKSREVPDYLSYFLIISGFGFRFFYSAIYNEWHYFLYGVGGFCIAFLLGSALYFTKQWGGGDTKLLMGLGVIFATKPYFIEEGNLFLGGLFFNIFIAGAIYGIFYGAYLAIKNKKDFVKEFKIILNESNIRFIRYFSYIFSFILIGLIFFSDDLATKLILGFFAFFIIFYIHLWIFVKSVENTCMFRILPTSQLTEGDWVTEDISANKKIIYSKNKLSVDKKDILNFIKYGVKNVKIKDGIPFVPSFLIGTIFTLIFGSLLW